MGRVNLNGAGVAVLSSLSLDSLSSGAKCAVPSMMPESLANSSLQRLIYFENRLRDNG